MAFMDEETQVSDDPLQLIRQMLESAADNIPESQRQENPLDFDRHVRMRVFAELIGQNTLQGFIAKQREDAASMTAERFDEEVRRFQEENHVDIALAIREFGDQLSAAIGRMMPKIDPDQIIGDMVSGDESVSEKLYQGKPE